MPVTRPMYDIVSSDSEELILVDEHDREIGTMQKADCHDGDGLLHRAFSVFVFDDRGRLLMQQRSAAKRLWPLYWSNSCCSHPRAGEEIDDAVSRRLEQELGLSCDPEFVFKFRYQASFGDLGSEHELCSVYLGQIDSAPQPNANEIADTRFVTGAELAAAFESAPERFTPWFRMEWDRLTTEYAERLRAYTAA